MGFPSPCGDKIFWHVSKRRGVGHNYRPLAGISCFRSFGSPTSGRRSSRPLAGISCFRKMSLTKKQELQCYRPLAGISCFHRKESEVKQMVEVTVPLRG